jgi:phosphatidylglycerol:prolipoprotein diacylglycerol transferase
MLPNLYWPAIPLGPLTIQVWGLMVALGIVASLSVAKRFAERRGLNADRVIDMAFWIILSAFIVSRIWFVVTEWELFSTTIVDIVKVWEGGLSMSGGLVGAVIAFILYCRKHKLSYWDYAEVLVYGLPFGEAIGRLGCFFIFDHPGTVTNFILGELYYGDGLVHHNHGLYLVLNGVILFLIFLYLRVKLTSRYIIFIPVYLLWNGLVRFILDFNRILDSRFFGLTAAQWLGLVMGIAGIVIMANRKKFRLTFLKF